MGDHLVLLVDRLLTESTLEAAVGSRNSLKQAANTTFEGRMSRFSPSDESRNCRKMVECRICLDEDVDSRMETPCSCSGSLKFAHRRCVQKWCHEKGNTTCEICHQQFKPGYTAPPPIKHLPVTLRGNWRIARRNLDSHRIIAMVSTDPPTFVDPDYNDYVSSTPRNMVLCRAIATMFAVVLLLGHILPDFSGDGGYPFSFLVMLMLMAAGIILSVFIVLKAAASVLQQQEQQGNLHASASVGEASPVINRIQQHVVAIR